MSKSQKIYNLSGLKVITIWLIFWLHSWLQNPSCDLGARGCEFFFVVSGFLTYLSMEKKQVPCTFGEAFAILKKKLISIWPLHFLSFVIILFSYRAVDVFTWQTGLKALINLSLLQSWISIDSIFFSFNGVSWFLSSLLFCYFCVPLLIRLIRRNQKVLVLFPLTFGFRYALEELQFRYPGQFWQVNVHVSPFLRMLEFFLGMMTCVIWLSCQRWLEKHFERTEKSDTLLRRVVIFLGLSVLEIGWMVLTWQAFLAKQNSWGRHIFTLWFCIFTFFMAFDGGILTKIFATKPFMWLSSIQMEFYMFHWPIIAVLTKYVEPMREWKVYELAGIAFFLSLMVSTIYHYVLRKPCEKAMKKVLDYLYAWCVS